MSLTRICSAEEIENLKEDEVVGPKLLLGMNEALIIVAHKEQLSMLEKYPRTLFADATHATNNSDFPLINFSIYTMIGGSIFPLRMQFRHPKMLLQLVPCLKYF